MKVRLFERSLLLTVWPEDPLEVSEFLPLRVGASPWCPLQSVRGADERLAFSAQIYFPELSGGHHVGSTNLLISI